MTIVRVSLSNLWEVLSNCQEFRLSCLLPQGVPHGTVAPLRPWRLGEPVAAAAVRVARCSSRQPPPRSAPPPQASGAVRCGEGPSPAPWLPFGERDGALYWGVSHVTDALQKSQRSYSAAQPLVSQSKKNIATAQHASNRELNDWWWVGG